MEVEQDNKSPPDFTSSISYWSDFSRVYYHPRGLCRLPDPADWERDVGWARGMDRYGELTAVRCFVGLNYIFIYFESRTMIFKMTFLDFSSKSAIYYKYVQCVAHEAQTACDYHRVSN